MEKLKEKDAHFLRTEMNISFDYNKQTQNDSKKWYHATIFQIQAWSEMECNGPLSKVHLRIWHHVIHQNNFSKVGLSRTKSPWPYFWKRKSHKKSNHFRF